MAEPLTNADLAKGLLSDCETFQAASQDRLAKLSQSVQDRFAKSTQAIKDTFHVPAEQPAAGPGKQSG